MSYTIIVDVDLSEAKGMETVKDLAVEVREYAVPNDFSNWKDHDTFETAFTRLLKDLRAEEARKT